MDDETMQLLKAMREQLGKTSASRTVDALAAANALGLESGSLDFDRRLQDLVDAEYLEEPANPALMAQGKYLIAFEGITAAELLAPLLRRKRPRPGSAYSHPTNTPSIHPSAWRNCLENS